MRIALFLFVFVVLQLNAQDKNKVALTAGSEFLEKNSETPYSITASQTMMICPYEGITKLNEKYVVKLSQSADIVSSQKINPILYLVIILLIGFSIHFFLSKREANFSSQIDLEEEEEEQRKKELWDAMAQPESGE